jgi:tetratricopeptide (TPR) repeat protein
MSRTAVVLLSMLVASQFACGADLGRYDGANALVIHTGVLGSENANAVFVGISDDWKNCVEGDLDLRIAACTAVIQTDHIESRELGLAYFTRANAYQGKHDYEHAIADYNEALRLSPGNQTALKFRGSAYARNGDFDRAVQDFEQVRLGPNDAEFVKLLVIVYNNRGLRYGNQNDYERAIQDFNKALALDPNFVEALSNRAAFAARKKDWDLAVQDLTRVLQLQPNRPEAAEYLVIAYNGRAHAYADRGDYDHAIQDCNEALRVRPNDTATVERLVSAYNNRGLAYSEKGDYERGLQDLDKAVELNPGYAPGFNNRGLLEAKKGDFGRAIQDFDQALRLDPKLSSALLGRGTAHYEKHEFDQALKDYDEVLRLDPGNANAKSQREKTLFVTGKLSRAPEAPAASRENDAREAFAVKNLLPFQRTFAALKSAGAYKGFAWPGVYEISNPTDRQVTIVDFRVLWPPASFEGKELRLAARSKPDRISVFDDLDALIKAQEEESDRNATKFPIQIPPHTRRYVIVHFVFDLLSKEGRPFEFQDQEKAYHLLSASLGWKPNSDGKFDCLNEDITVEITTPGREQLKFASLTGLLMPGCQLYLPSTPAPPFSVSNSGGLPSGNASNSGQAFSLERTSVSKGLSISEYTKIILREPGNADAFNERGKAYRAIGDFEHAIDDFNHAISLRPFFREAKLNLEEARKAKARKACGFQLFCDK